MAKVEGLYRNEMVELIESDAYPQKVHLVMYLGKKIYIPVSEFKILKINDGRL